MSNSVTSIRKSNSATKKTMGNEEVRDYRAFVFVVHQDHGMLLLHRTGNSKKGPHFQLPGGNVGNFEFDNATKMLESDATSQDLLLQASKIGASRELFDSTGIDVRKHLRRLVPLKLRPRDFSVNNKQLICEVRRRIYFFLAIKDEDFFESTGAWNDKQSVRQNALKKPLGQNAPDLLLKISEKYSGFLFEMNPKESATKIRKHSGGVGSRALMMATIAAQNSKLSSGLPLPTDSMDFEFSSSSDESSISRASRHSPPTDTISFRSRPEKRGVFTCNFCSFMHGTTVPYSEHISKVKHFEA